VVGQGGFVRFCLPTLRMCDVLTRHFDLVASLGSTCVASRFADTCLRGGAACARMPFDNVATPAWTVFDLLQDDLVVPTTPAPTFRKLSSHEGWPPNWTWMERYLRVPHHIDRSQESVSAEEASGVVETFARRCARLRAALASAGRVLFVRVEEWSRGRHVHTEHHRARYEQRTELEYLREACVSVRRRLPRLATLTLFFTQTSTSPCFDRASGVLSLPLPPERYVTWESGVQLMEDAVERHRALVLSCVDELTPSCPPPP